MALLTKRIVERKLAKVSLNTSAEEYEINKGKFCKTAADAKELIGVVGVITKNKLAKLIAVLMLVCINALQKQLGCNTKI